MSMNTNDIFEAALCKTAMQKTAVNAWGVADTVTDFVPFVGSAKDIGKGVYGITQGNWKQGLGDIASGALWLPLDFMSLGAASLLKGTGKTLFKGGLKSLFKGGFGTGLKNMATTGAKQTLTRQGAKTYAAAVPIAAAGLYAQHKDNQINQQTDANAQWLAANRMDRMANTPWMTTPEAKPTAPPAQPLQQPVYQAPPPSPVVQPTQPITMPVGNASPHSLQPWMTPSVAPQPYKQSSFLTGQMLASRGLNQGGVRQAGPQGPQPKFDFFGGLRRGFNHFVFDPKSFLSGNYNPFTRTAKPAGGGAGIFPNRGIMTGNKPYAAPPVYTGTGGFIGFGPRNRHGLQEFTKLTGIDPKTTDIKSLPMSKFQTSGMLDKASNPWLM